MSISVRKTLQPIPEPPLDLKPIPVNPPSGELPKIESVKKQTIKNTNLFS